MYSEGNSLTIFQSEPMSMNLDLLYLFLQKKLSSTEKLGYKPVCLGKCVTVYLSSLNALMTD